MVGWTMPTNTLRTQASRFLHLALKAHDKGQLMDAHQFTVKAAELLEGAVSLEELRKATSRVRASSPRHSYTAASQEQNLTTAEECRARAAQCDEKAGQAKDPEAKRLLEDAAAEWRTMAVLADRHAVLDGRRFSPLKNKS